MYYSPRTHNISRDIPRERRQTRLGYVLSPLAPIALDLLLSRLCSRQQTMTDSYLDMLSSGVLEQHHKPNSLTIGLS
jgi:hypothetical protein